MGKDRMRDYNLVVVIWRGFAGNADRRDLPHRHGGWVRGDSLILLSSPV